MTLYTKLLEHLRKTYHVAEQMVFKPDVKDIIIPDNYVEGLAAFKAAKWNGETPDTLLRFAVDAGSLAHKDKAAYTCLITNTMDLLQQNGKAALEQLPMLNPIVEATARLATQKNVINHVAADNYLATLYQATSVFRNVTMSKRNRTQLSNTLFNFSHMVFHAGLRNKLEENGLLAEFDQEAFNVLHCWHLNFQASEKAQKVQGFDIPAEHHELNAKQQIEKHLLALLNKGNIWPLSDEKNFQHNLYKLQEFAVNGSDAIKDVTLKIIDDELSNVDLAMELFFMEDGQRPSSEIYKLYGEMDALQKARNSIRPKLAVAA